MAFSGKVVLITGATGGIGAETALAFSKAGASLSLTGQNVDKLKTVAAECGGALTIPADLTKADNLKKIMDLTIEKYGRLDVLVNNAAIIAYGSVETAPIDQLDSMYNVNLRPAYQLTSLAVPHLAKTQGCVVNISSFLGHRAIPGILTYSMMKAALDHFTRITALDLAPKKIRVNSVNPAFVETQLHRRSGVSEEAYVKLLERAKVTHPLGRAALPSDVAECILFLASPQAAYLTGVILPCDGGRAAAGFN